MTVAQQPPGWFPDPDGGGGLRYWDGTQWTDQRAPAAPAAPVAKKRRGRGCLTVIGAVVVLFVLLIVVVAILGGTKTKSATDQVKLTKCNVPDAIGVVYVEGTADNTTSKRSTFTISVTVSNPAGVQIGSGGTVVSDVDAGRKAVWKALTDTDRSKWVKGSTCKVTDVTRFASNP